MAQRISPSRYRRNVANELAHELLDALHPDHPTGCESSCERDGIRATLVVDRHWEIVEDADGGMPIRHALSGHATLFVASERPWKHRVRPAFVRERLLHGWQPTDLARGIFHALAELAAIDFLSAWRERVFDEVQARELEARLPEKLDDHPTHYEDMTQADCEFWLDYLSRLPEQTFSYRAALPWRPGRRDE
ncbi:MAG: hypothetical protein JJU22_17510 [Gammaproteobacteria bacterium]|nr:hypothetical protein [Gammaproteobacteria bacterium]